MAESGLSVFTCKDHDGIWPVGACSVVIAASESEARALLEAELKQGGLSPKDFTLQLLDTSTPRAIILLNGDY